MLCTRVHKERNKLWMKKRYTNLKCILFKNSFKLSNGTWYFDMVVSKENRKKENCQEISSFFSDQSLN